MQAGADPAGVESQAVAKRWHAHLQYFYEPTVAILRGLGGGYVSDPAFAEKFAAQHPELPAFLQAAIEAYCDGLEG